MVIPIRIKHIIKKLHLIIDALVGRFLFKHSNLLELSESPHKQLMLENFYDFLYSRYSHFSCFRVLPGYQNQTTATCDLKVYQDALVFTYILDQFPRGGRLLEIGGGESRIIHALKDSYEIWNLDKLEGEGFGPKELISDKGFKLVSDYIGSYSHELPDEYFDLVFSISTLEHIPQDIVTIDAVIGDIQRLLKPGGYSLHCVDSLLLKDGYIFPDILSVLHQRGMIPVEFPLYERLLADRDLWLVPKYSYYTRWYPLVRKPMSVFGYPFSINVLWRK